MSVSHLCGVSGTPSAELVSQGGDGPPWGHPFSPSSPQTGVKCSGTACQDRVQRTGCLLFPGAGLLGKWEKGY